MLRQYFGFSSFREGTGYRFALLTQDKNNVRNISFYGTTQQKGHETVNETGLLCGCRGGA